jgi:GNAT superfamily N-acetyltransferase
MTTTKRSPVYLVEGDFASFFRVPFVVYPATMPWVSMLKSDLKALLDEKKNPHWQVAERTYFTAMRDGVPVGRILCHVHHAANERFGEKAASFGFFDVEDDVETARALLSKAEEFARARHLTLLRGNMNLTANQEIGVLTDGDDKAPFVAQMFQPEWVSKLLVQCGFAATMPMTTFARFDVAAVDLDKIVTDKHRALMNDPDYVWREFRMNRFDDDVEIVRTILNDSMGQNPLFVPMTKEEARFQLGPMKMIMDPKLTRIAEFKGEPIGATICIPDPNPLLKKIGSRLTPWGLLRFLLEKKKIRRASVIIILVKRAYHGQGVIGVLNHDMMKALKEGGYTEMGGTWISDTNKASLKQAQLTGLHPHHRLALFEKSLA